MSPFWFALAISCLLSSCSLNRHVPAGKQLVNQVKIKGAPKDTREDLYNLVEQKPNRRIFGIYRFHLRMYYLSKRVKFSKKSDDKSIWEEPVYYSDEASQRSALNMTNYLRNSGYFNADVDYELKQKGKKKVKVEYQLNSRKQYRIKEVVYQVEDYYLNEIINNKSRASLIKSGQAFHSEKFAMERDRLTRLIRENGYFDFTRDYIYFDVDSTIAGKNVNVYIGIRNPDNYQRHRPYIQRYVYLVGENVLRDKAKADTIKIAPGFFRIGQGNSYHDELAMNALLSDSGDLFNEQTATASLKNLKELTYYRYVDLAYNKIDSNSGDTAFLDMTISLYPDTRWAIQLQAETITSEQKGEGLSFNGRLYGLAGSITFLDNDFASRGIRMSSRLRAATEFDAKSFPRFIANTELGLSNELQFEKPFLSQLMPLSFRKDIKSSNLNLSGFFESNPDFQRWTVNTSAGYRLNAGRFRHYILPVEFSLIGTRIISEGFQQRLDTSANLFLKNLFDNHGIGNFRWASHYSSRTLGKKDNYFELNVNFIELAGNLFWLMAPLVGNELPNNTTFENELLGIRYFQYVKGDYDFRFHHETTWGNEVVYRLFFGMIWPYGNTPNSVPFEKRYYVGGSNSIRGWRVRSLGPGSFDPGEDENFVYFHSGDIKLEMNLEYRFSLSDLMKMALFFDSGNIWNHPSNQFQVEGGAWEWNSFYKQLAVAGGLGLRFDFTYFVFRTDIGMRMRDPASTGDLWFSKRYFQPFKMGEALQFNFGIGYPF